MFSFLNRRKSQIHRVMINDKAMESVPKETLLNIALRNDVDFPNSCRVGSCTSCKCLLLNGQVNELTDVGYILSEEELDKGYILACQSVPISDISVHVSSLANSINSDKIPSVNGTVVMREPLTQDIVRLHVKLEEPIAYKAGQFADISLPMFPTLKRSYSFASPFYGEQFVSFFVKKITGGIVSSAIHEQDLIGSAITLEGPKGNFWLRPSNAPIVMVAGGSGLAPLLAMLQQALGIKREVTLIFSAKTQQDLYALDEIQTLSQQWKAPFQFTPTLTREPSESIWHGQRGHVVDILSNLELSLSDFYVCGAPSMVDVTTQYLKDRGVSGGRIYVDPFTSRSPDGLHQQSHFDASHDALVQK